jgi:type I restriction enzyme S subunit
MDNEAVITAQTAELKPTFKCISCKRVYVRKTELDKHVLAKHPIIIANGKEEANPPVENTKDVKPQEQIKENIIDEIKIYKCDIDKCKQKPYLSESNLIRHKKLKHKDAIKDEKNIILNDVSNIVKTEDQKNIIIEKNNILSDEENVIMSIFIKIENMLYSEGITGEKAKNIIVQLLLIKLLEPHIDSGEIDFKDIKKHHYDTDEITDVTINYYKLSVILEKDNHDNKDEILIDSRLHKIWKFAFAKHPITSQFFKEYIYIQNKKILMVILKLINSINISGNAEILSNVYQHFIHKQFKGDKSSKLGQHFTPREISSFMGKLLNPYFTENKTYCDPFCGVAGFLYDVCNNCPNINVDNLNGTEIDINVFEYAVANILIKTGKVAKNIMHRSAFEEHTDKYDIILSNPPFALKFMKDQIDTKWFTDIKTKSGNLLTLLLLMHLLKKDGICATVYPCGAELTGLRDELTARKQLVEKFDLQKIIILESGIFEYTSINTVIIVFKNSEQKTTNVEFCKFNSATQTEELIKIVPITDIIKNKYSLNINSYKEKIIKNYNFEIKKLNEICDFQNGKSLTRSNIVDGIYPVIGGGKTPIGYHNEYNRDENTILISSSGSAGYISRYKEKIWSSDCISIKSKDEKIITNNYLYYWLISQQNYIYTIQSGAAQPHIYSKDLADLDIPLPPLEIQNMIIKIMDELFEINNNLQKILSLYENKIKYSNIFFNIKNIENKKLKDVCDIKNGSNFTSDKIINGEYPVIGGGQSPMGFHNSYNVDELTTIISKDGSYSGFISRYNTKAFITNHGIYLNNYKNIDKNYLYYYLSTIQDELYKLQVGAAQPGIKTQDLGEIDIPVPPLEKQQEIIKIMDELFANIENIKKMLISSEQDKKIIFEKLMEN